MMTRPHCLTNFVPFLLCLAATTASAQTFTILHDFSGPNGAIPSGALVQGTDGNIYGTTLTGGHNFPNGEGTLFKITPTGILSKLHDFCLEPNCTDGSLPQGMILLPNGSFLGSTYQGGIGNPPYENYGGGSVFNFLPPGKLAVLHDFCTKVIGSSCPDGDAPLAVPVPSFEGSYFGTTMFGGSLNCEPGGPYVGCGVIFKMNPTGSVVPLHYFAGPPTEGTYPEAALIQATDGNFYGTTAYGGSSDDGTIFKITPGGEFTTVHRFSGSDGSNPFSALLQASDGNLYGTASSGGTGGHGTVFRLTPQGSLSTIHNFSGADGEQPFAGLIQASDGLLYGSTDTGFNNGGVIFRVGLDGAFAIEHSIKEGYRADNTLLQATNGTFYGSTLYGGNGGQGLIFSLSLNLQPFVSLVRSFGKVGQICPLLGQGFLNANRVTLNGLPASFTVVSDSFMQITVPSGATSGYITVIMSGGTLTSNAPFRVIP